MKKKLIFVTEALWIGGIETALVNLLNRLDYGKYEVTCLVLRGELDLAGRLPPGCRLLVADRERGNSFDRPYGFRRLCHLTEIPTNPSRLHKALLWAVPALRWLEKWLDGDDNYELVSVDSLAMSAGTYSHPNRNTPFDEQSKEFRGPDLDKKKKRKGGR